MTKDALIDLAVQTANAHQLDPVLVCSVVEQESAWDTFAIRFEPGFYTRYVAPQALASQTESQARAFSWGLMQVMGQTAREAGFKGRYLSMLCNPGAGLDIGCKVLKGKLARHPQSVESGLLAWNGGGRPEYASEVLARMSSYKSLSLPAIRRERDV